MARRRCPKHEIEVSDLVELRQYPLRSEICGTPHHFESGQDFQVAVCSFTCSFFGLCRGVGSEARDHGMAIAAPTGPVPRFRFPGHQLLSAQAMLTSAAVDSMTNVQKVCFFVMSFCLFCCSLMCGLFFRKRPWNWHFWAGKPRPPKSRHYVPVNVVSLVSSSSSWSSSSLLLLLLLWGVCVCACLIEGRGGRGGSCVASSFLSCGAWCIGKPQAETGLTPSTGPKPPNQILHPLLDVRNAVSQQGPHNEPSSAKLRPQPHNSHATGLLFLACCTHPCTQSQNLKSLLDCVSGRAAGRAANFQR